MKLSDDPPARARPPREGPYDSPDSHLVTVIVEVLESRIGLRGWCRVGVWTTLDSVAAEDFVLRESWGRLGERKPRRLSRVEDQALGGVVARLRPEKEGSLTFVVEIARAKVGRGRKVGEYHGREIQLPDVRRYGYRFEGRAPPRFAGMVARWGPDVRVRLGPDPASHPKSVRFETGGVAGLVVGPDPAAEAFVETWEPVEPVRFEADGVERMDFRLERKRRAAGFRGGGREVYGAEFRFRIDG